MDAFRAIGQPLAQVEGPAKVTGQARFAADIDLPGMLWGRLLRSPYPHARIIRVDASRARALPGVRAVVTAQDIPPILTGRQIKDMPVLAREMVRFVGERVAAVAAEEAAIAEEALGLIEVEYEELPTVFDPREAMEEDAPRVHEDPSSYEGFYKPTPPLPNLESLVTWGKGNVEEGFAESDYIFEHTFSSPLIHQLYMEPHACVVSIDGDGRVQVWTACKTPYSVREELAFIAGLAEDRIRVNPCPIGGDFGAKGTIMDVPIAYFLARAAGRPVKVVMSYTEEFMAANPRHPAIITIKTGVKKDGRLWARQATCILNSGAYGAHKPLYHSSIGGFANACGNYRIPHARIDAYCVYTNAVPCGHFRAPGAPQSVFAGESQIDIIARELGLDPLEFRLRNAPEGEDELPTGLRLRHIRMKETLRAAAEAAGWGRPKPPDVGRGIAIYDRLPGGQTGGAAVALAQDGSVVLALAVPDTGTGSHTVLQQVVAQELSLPVEEVRVVSVGTDDLPPDSGAGNSRVTHVGGQACLRAAQELRRRLVAAVARLQECPEEAIALSKGEFIVNGERRLPFRQAAVDAVRHEGPIAAQATYTPEGPVQVTCFCAQVAEVAVDRETGCVRVQRLVSAHDVGTIINPLYHQGQIEGGIIMGLGHALMEELRTEEGAVTTLHLGDVKVPSVKDVPELVTVLLEPGEGGPAPYQGKAIGEMANVPTAAAIANAVADAVGVRIVDLPITAEKVLWALRQKT